MTQGGPAACLLLSFFFVPASASSVEWLTGHDLERSCDLLLEGADNDTHNPDGGLCLAFIQGFLAGTDAGEVVVAPGNASSSSQDGENYAQRAARTRLGTLRLQKLQSGPPAWCIDETVSAIEVVRKVTAWLEDHASAADLTASDALREALVSGFPCPR